MDLFGPINVMSLSKKKYTPVIVDEFSRYTWVFFLYFKDETPHVIINFVKKVETLNNSRVRVLRSDQGTEFRNSTLINFC